MSILPTRRGARPWLHPHRTLPSGFTLVEVLVALMVMAVMAGMAWRGVDGIVRTRDGAQARLDQTLRLNTVMAQWEHDLHAVQDSTVLPQALSCDGASVRLTRHTPTGLQVVAWSLRPDPAGGAWVRWAGPSVTTNAELQESWLRSLQLQGTEDGSLRALTGLSEWQVYFYQGNGWANCQSTGNLVTTTVTTGGTGTTGGGPQSLGSASSPTGSGTGSPGGLPSQTPLPTQAFQAVTNRQALPSGVRLVLKFTAASGYAGDVTRDLTLGP